MREGDARPVSGSQAWMSVLLTWRAIKTMIPFPIPGEAIAVSGNLYFSHRSVNLDTLPRFRKEAMF